MSFGEKILSFFKKYYIIMLAVLLVAVLVIGVFYVYGGDGGKDESSTPVIEDSKEEEIRYYVIDIKDVEKYVTVGKYEGVEVEKTVVTEELLESYRLKALDKVKEFVDAGRPAQKGVSIVIDYEGFYKESGVKFSGGSDTDATFVLGNGNYIPGFEDAIVGHRADEKFDIFVTFPQDYDSVDLRGVEARFSISLKRVYQIVYPEITDEVAKKLNFESADKLNEAIQKAAEKEVNTANQDKAWKAAVANCTLKEYPKELYDQAVNDFVVYYMAYYKEAAAKYGVEIEELLDQTEEELEAELIEKGKENANGYLKEEMFMFAIAKAMGKDTISDEEFNKAVQEFASNRGVTTDELKEEFTDQQLKTNILWDRVMTHVADKAVFVTTKDETSEENSVSSEDAPSEDGASSEEASAE